MESALAVRRVIAKVAVGLLICTAVGVSIFLLDRLHSALAYLPYLALYWGSGWLVFRLVREDSPENIIEWVEVFVYGLIVTFVGAVFARWIL